MSTAVIWSKSKPDVESQYGGRLGEFNDMSCQSHLLHCRVLPLGEFNVMIVPHCRCNNSLRHVENRFRHILFYFFLKCSLSFDERRLLYRLRYTCYISYTTATLYSGEIGVRSICRQRLVIAQKYSAEVRRNFGTRSAPSPKTSASAEHYKSMFGAPLLRLECHSGHEGFDMTSQVIW